MILLDTSVLIAQIRTGDAQLLSQFALHNAAICGVTRAEVLYGIRSNADHARFMAAMNSFPQVEIPAALWDQVGLNLALLRANGFKVPLADAVIASLAVDLDVELWARNNHFRIIQQCLPALRLFAEPP